MASSASGMKTGTVFILSIVFGLVAAGLSYLYLKNREAAILKSLAGEEETLVAVVVAKQDITRGTKISVGDFAVRQIPGNYVHPSAISPNEFNDYVGEFLVEDISRGKTLLRSFIDESFPRDFSDLVKKGRRAITVQVDEPVSIAGMMRPGNRIDIFVNIGTKVVGYDAGGGINLPAGLQEAALQYASTEDIPPEVVNAIASTAKPNDVILPVLQDVMVLATGRETYDENLDSLGQPQRRRGNTFTSVTLDVTSEQAALLTLAEDKGDLVGILRNRHDRSMADFSGITPLDLYSNATKMKKQAAMQKAAEAAGATIDENGNWVTADGQVINKDDIVISEDGTVVTKGGKLLGAKGISVNENGDYVDADGNVIPPDEIIVNPDGTVTTKDELMKAAGYTVNENGDYVDANGNIVKKDDIKVLANGTVMSADGKVLSGPNVTVNEDGFIIAEDGTVMTADGKVLTGVTVNENGEVVGPDGTVLKDANLTIAEDGTVRDSSGNIIAGVTGSNLPAEFGADIPDEDTLDQLIQAATTGITAGNYVALIIGGQSKEGVALTSRLAIQPVAGGLPENQAPEQPEGEGQ